MVMGEQDNPICAVISCTTTPKSPRSVDTPGWLAVATLLQHCAAPVLHWLEGLLPVGTATANAARARVVRVERVVNCILDVRVTKVGIG